MIGKVGGPGGTSRVAGSLTSWLTIWRYLLVINGVLTFAGWVVCDLHGTPIGRLRRSALVMDVKAGPFKFITMIFKG